MVIALCGLALAPAVAEAAPTRAEYIATVDPLCQAGDKRTVKALGGYARALKRDRYKQAGRILRRGVNVFAASVARVSGVEPPTADAAIIARWLSLERRDIGFGRRAAAGLIQEKLGKFNKHITQSRAIEPKIDAAIGDYGFAECN